jgi:hypothetical protein
VPNGPREDGVFLEVWCDLMKGELKIAREEIAKVRREGANERQWLYTQSCLKECLSSLEIISRLIPKKQYSSSPVGSNLSFDRRRAMRLTFLVRSRSHFRNIRDGARFDNHRRANEFAREIQARMPVFLPEEHHDYRVKPGKR